MSAALRSTAVMQRRAKISPPRPDDSKDSLDFYPTPAWATRALCEWLQDSSGFPLYDKSAWEPACGEHHMVRPLKEYFGSVHASDVADHNGGHLIEDFLFPSDHKADWIITNPPFSLAQQFATTGIGRALQGVAILTRIAFLESVGRYHDLFVRTPPSDILQFVERVPMLKGRVERDAASATAYCWLVFRKGAASGTRFHWIPPCRKRLERDSDYPTARAAE